MTTNPRHPKTRLVIVGTVAALVCILAVSATAGGPPPNDACSGAISVGDGSTPFNTMGATTDGPALPPVCDEGFGLDFGQDIWFCYTAACTGTIRVSLCGSGYDTRMAVYAGCACPATNARLIVCNDDFCGVQSEASFAATAGSSYLIRVGGFATEAGAGTMTLTCTPPMTDCNSNGVDDGADIAAGTSQDCNSNAVPDECDITGGTSADLDSDGIPDECTETPFTDGTEWKLLQLVPGANFYEIRDAALAYYAAHPQALGQNSFRRWDIFWQRRVNLAEDVPGDFRYALEAAATTLTALPPVCPPPSIPASNWRPLGPFQRPDEPTSGATANGVGIVICFWVNPSNHDHILMGAEFGGLWKTTNGGANWSSLTDFSRLPNVGVRDIAVDPTDYNTIYIVAGFGDHGLGVLKSTDGGTTWNSTDLMYSVATPIAIRNIRHHPTTSGTLYAAVGNGVYKTTDGGATWLASLLMRSTSSLVAELTQKPGDPTTWYATSTHVGGGSCAGPCDTQVPVGCQCDELCCVFGDCCADKVAVCGGCRPGGATRILKIVDSGSGLSYTDITPVVSGFTPHTGGYLLAVTPAAANYLYAYYITNAGAFMIKSTNTGDTWATPVPTTRPDIAGANQNGLIVSPTDPMVMYLAGVRVWKSTNEGASFTAVTNNCISGCMPRPNNYAHDDCRAQVFLSGTSGGGSNQDVVLIGTDGGPYKTEKGGQTWTGISGYGLNITKFYGLSSSYDHTIEFGGAQDLASLRYDYGTARWWNPARIGDAYESVIDRANSSILYTQGNTPYLYKSTDAGQTLFGIPQPSCTQPCQPCGVENVRPMVIDSLGRLYIGHHDVWRSTTGGATWTQLSNFTASFNNRCGRGLFSIAVAPSDSNRIYAAYPNPLYCNHENGTTCSPCCRPEKMIFRSSVVGEWTDITQSPIGPEFDLKGVEWSGISHVEVDPTNPDRIWVSFNAYWDGFRVWHSPDAGNKWYNVSQGLPNSPVHDIVYQRCSPDHLYAGTDQGVYFWDSTMNQWVCWSDNLPIAIGWDLEINEAAGTILAGTHGRGLWEADLVPSNTSCGCKRPPNGMVLWTSMDEPGGTSAFNAVGGHPGTHVNGPTPAPGRVGSARLYDSDLGQYTAVPWYSAIELKFSDFSIDGWIKRTSSTNLDGLRTIMDKRKIVGPGVTVGYHLFMIDGELGLQLATNGPETNFYGGPSAHIPLDTQWHQFAVTVDRNNTQGLRFYVDGQPAGPSQDPSAHQGSLLNHVPFTIGSWTGGDGAYLQGGLDELEVFSRALTATEVLGLYNAQDGGKCRFLCHVPSNIGFCPSETSRTMTAYLRNNSFLSRSLTYWFQGMAGGSGCNVAGPTGFTPSGHTTVTVPAKTSLPVTVTIQRPANFNTNDHTSCYIMFVKDNVSGEVFSCRGSVRAIDPCGGFPVTCCPPLPALQATNFGPVTVTNEGSMAIDLAYRFVVLDEDDERDVQFVSLNGLAAGAPAEGFIALSAGGSAEVEIAVELLIDNPLGFLTLVLEADMDGDGEFEPITSTFIRGEIPPSDVPPMTGACCTDNFVCAPDLTFDECAFIGGLAWNEGQPCSSCPQLDPPSIVTLPVSPRPLDEYVNVRFVNPTASLVEVYQLNDFGSPVLLGSVNPAGATELAVPTTSLPAGVDIVARQRVGPNVSDDSTPVAVNFSGNGPLRIAMAIRETDQYDNLLDCGDDGTGIDPNQPSTREFVGAASTSAFGVPNGLRVLTDPDWMEISLDPCVDGVTAFSGNGVVFVNANGETKSVWEGLYFRIDSLYPTAGPYTIYIDDVIAKNAYGPGQDCVVDDFESYTPGDHIVAGANNVCDTTANNTPPADDAQVVPVGGATFNGQIVVSPGPNGILETTASTDDFFSSLKARFDNPGAAGASGGVASNPDQTNVTDEESFSGSQSLRVRWGFVDATNPNNTMRLTTNGSTATNPPETLKRPDSVVPVTYAECDDGVDLKFNFMLKLAPAVVLGDCDLDGDVDLADIGCFQDCFGETPVSAECDKYDLDLDGEVDLADYTDKFRYLIIGPHS